MEPFDPWGKEPPPDASTDADTEYEQLAQRTRRVNTEADNLRIRDEARRLLNREKQALRPAPLLVNLADFLTEQDNDPTYRIDKLWPTGGRILIPAQFKAGKTTLVGNLVRSLADGTPFLDTFGVRPANNIILIDDELDTRVLRRWLRDHQITNQTAINLIPLRGNVTSFDILDPDTLETWTKLLHGADIVIIDCLRPILDALGLDENHDAGRFLVALDTLLADAQCTESAVIHHMGHNGERSRGDSRLNDWPDAIWKLVRDKDDENPDLDDVEGARYFSAYGRDVDYPQSELTYDRDTRHLGLGERPLNRKMSTAKKKERNADEMVMEAIVQQPGLNKRALRESARRLGVGHAEDVDSAVERLVQNGRIWRQKAGSAFLHWPSRDLSERGVSSVSEPCPTLLDTPEPSVSMCLSTPLRGGGHVDTPRSHTEDDADRVQTPELDTPGPTKTCPDCGANIPAHHTRCATCVMALIDATRGGKP